jgi:hypothetical protein
MIQLSIGNQAIESTLLIETYFGAGVFCASGLRVKRGAEREKSLRAYGYWKLNGAEKHFVKAKWLWTGSFIVSGVWRRIVQKGCGRPTHGLLLGWSMREKNPLIYAARETFLILFTRFLLFK